MSEQKYYVLLNTFSGQLKRIQLVRFGFANELIDFACPKLARGNYLLKGKQHQFTKSQLSKIMDGYLYREPFLGEAGIQSEWINQLIELVPVEDVEP